MLEVKNLTKYYGKKLAVDNISFTVDHGIVGLLGTNGAGKSTTMNMITGYLASSAGEVYVSGKDILNDPVAAKSQLGYLPEKPPLYVDMTVREYLQFVMRLKKIKRPKQHIDEVCAKVGITHVSERLIKHLSKGYCQRVGIAQAILGSPDIVILDEPMVGLDPVQIIEIRDLIKSLGKHCVVILSSHILVEVETICDRVIVIRHGKLVADDSPAQLRIQLGGRKLVAEVEGDAETVLALLQQLQGVESLDVQPSTREGCCRVQLVQMCDADVRHELFFALAESKLPLLELHSEGSSLEDAFIALTVTDKQEV